MPRRLGASRFGDGDTIEVVRRELWNSRATAPATARRDFDRDGLRFKTVESSRHESRGQALRLGFERWLGQGSEVRCVADSRLRFGQLSVEFVGRRGEVFPNQSLTDRFGASYESDRSRWTKVWFAMMIGIGVVRPTPT